MTKDQSFVSKYRPNKLSGVVGNIESIKKLHDIKIGEKPPHLLLSGFHGTGKTTAAFIVCRRALGDNWKNETLILNSSSDRGINVIRDDIREFASLVGIEGKPRMIILDEADNLTKDAQKALRGTMEDFSNNVSFILTCNYPHKIIDPIKSRCMNLNFEPISKEQTIKLISDICIKENIDLDPSLAEKLAEENNGDMRPILYKLESFKRMNKKITLKDFNSLPIDEIQKLSKIVLTGGIKNFIASQKILKELNKKGIDPHAILDGIFKELENTPMDPPKKLDLYVKFSEFDRNLTMGTTPYIQLIGLISFITKVMGIKK